MPFIFRKASKNVFSLFSSCYKPRVKVGGDKHGFNKLSRQSCSESQIHNEECDTHMRKTKNRFAYASSLIKNLKHKLKSKK